MTVKLTNCLDSILKLNYRMPKTAEGRSQPVLSVVLQPRALANEVEFPTEAYYNEFKRQNESYFKNNIVLEGKATEKQAVASNSKLAEDSTKNVKGKTDKEIEKLQEGAKNVKAKLTIVEEKAGN